jgi:hypothetical protein
MCLGEGNCCLSAVEGATSPHGEGGSGSEIIRFGEFLENFYLRHSTIVRLGRMATFVIHPRGGGSGSLQWFWVGVWPTVFVSILLQVRLYSVHYTPTL